MIVESPEEEIDYLKIFKKYYEIRKKFGVAISPRFFMRYQNGKCVNQPVGKHTFARMPSIIAKFLNLPDANLYTGHCFRRSSATLLVNSGGDLLDLKRHGAWRSSNVAETYVADSVMKKIDISNKILYNRNYSNQDCAASTGLEMPSTSKSQTQAVSAPQNFEKSKFRNDEIQEATFEGGIKESQEINLSDSENVVLKNPSFSGCSVVFNFFNK